MHKSSVTDSVAICPDRRAKIGFVRQVAIKRVVAEHNIINLAGSIGHFRLTMIPPKLVIATSMPFLLVRV